MSPASAASPTPVLTLVLAHLALLVSNSLLGVGSVVSKVGLEGCNPVIFALLRELLAAPLLFIMSVFLENSPSSGVEEGECSPAHPDGGATRGRGCFTCLDAIQFLLAGSMVPHNGGSTASARERARRARRARRPCEPPTRAARRAQLFGTNLGYIVGVKFLGATAAAIWQSSLPVFATVIAMLVGYERLTLLKGVGVLCAFAGCAFLTLFNSKPESGGEYGGTGEVESAADAQLTGNLIFLVQVIACAAFFVAGSAATYMMEPVSES